MSKGWRLVHGAQGGLVTDGVYAFVCHSQYTGLFLIIVGFLVQWPTLLTVCSESAVSGLQQERALPTGETVAVEFLPDQPGEYDFACPMGMFRGKLVVE